MATETPPRKCFHDCPQNFWCRPNSKPNCLDEVKRLGREVQERNADRKADY